MLGALKKGARGIVTYDKDACIGCRYCQVACPFNVPKFEWSSATPKIVKCELCPDRMKAGKPPACVEVCPREAIIFGKLDDLKREAHRRIDSKPDRYQPKVYGEDDLGGTQVLYLAAVPFTKLGLPDKGRRSGASVSESLQHGIYQGFVAPALLYAGLAAAVIRNRKKGDQ
jgi:Fe-S-cluster-containing dehydrogenase component